MILKIHSRSESYSDAEIDSYKILIFDSGSGGRSLIDPIQNGVENAYVIYIEDKEFFPYGRYDADFICSRVLDVISQACDDYNPDMIVVACNTASLCAKHKLRETIQIPIICLDPAIKPAVKITENGNIGLIATPVTVKHPLIENMIHDVASDLNFVKFSDNRLTELAEFKFNNELTKIDFPNDLVQGLQDTMADVDTIILGCTHYHFIENEFKYYLPHVKYFSNPIEGVVKQIHKKISEETD